MGTATSNIAKNTQNNKVQTKDEEQRRRLNRQINFLIMRDAWQIVRRHEYGDAFEDALSSSRTRVSKAIDGKNIVPSADNLKAWVDRFHISGGIFSGEERFNFNDLYDNKEPEIIFYKKGQTKEIMAWSAVIENYCKQRAAHANNGKEELQKEYEANHIIYEKAIKMFLRNTWEKAKADKSMSCYSNDFIRFCLYVRDGTSLTTAEMIRLDQLKIKKDLTFKNIDSLEIGDVKKLWNTLNEIANIAKTVYNYKTLKEKKTNKQK